MYKLNSRRILYVIFQLLTLAIFIYIFLLMPETSHASLESSLLGIKSKLTGFILPVLSVCGLALAALSLFSGQEQAKQHILYAILGCAFGFGAQAIVDFISQTVH